MKSYEFLNATKSRFYSRLTRLRLENCVQQRTEVCTLIVTGSMLGPNDGVLSLMHSAAFYQAFLEELSRLHDCRARTSVTHCLYPGNTTIRQMIWEPELYPANSFTGITMTSSFSQAFSCVTTTLLLPHHTRSSRETQHILSAVFTHPPFISLLHFQMPRLHW